jgi:hypothetical protein
MGDAAEAAGRGPRRTASSDATDSCSREGSGAWTGSATSGPDSTEVGPGTPHIPQSPDDGVSFSNEQMGQDHRPSVVEGGDGLRSGGRGGGYATAAGPRAPGGG